MMGNRRERLGAAIGGAIAFALAAPGGVAAHTLNATYERVLESKQKSVWGDRMDIPAFSALTVGTHVLFGR